MMWWFWMLITLFLSLSLAFSPSLSLPLTPALFLNRVSLNIDHVIEFYCKKNKLITFDIFNFFFATFKNSKRKSCNTNGEMFQYGFGVKSINVLEFFFEFSNTDTSFSGRCFSFMLNLLKNSLITKPLGFFSSVSCSECENIERLNENTCITDENIRNFDKVKCNVVNEHQIFTFLFDRIYF